MILFSLKYTKNHGRDDSPAHPLIAGRVHMLGVGAGILKILTNAGKTGGRFLNSSATGHKFHLHL